MHRATGVAMAMALALAIASPVAADTTGGGPSGAFSDGMTITITSTRVIAKVLVEVNADITCGPAPDEARWEDNYFTAYVKQASGRSIATGSVDWWVPDIAGLCDGSAHHVTATVPADFGSVPFKAGKAAVGVTGNASYSQQVCTEFGCDYHWDSFGASTGWVVTRLGR